MAIENKKDKITIDDIALMIGKGFEHVDKRFKQVDKRMDSLERGQKEIIKSNTQEHEAMQMKLDNVAYRFELVELQHRVEILEKKLA